MANDPMTGVERRGDKFLIYSEAVNEARQEMIISGSALAHLSRLLPSFLRKIAEGMLPVGPGQSVSAAVPINDVRIVEDLHHDSILLSVKDIAGGDFDYSMTPNLARKVGRALAERADFVDRENAKKRGH